MSLSNSWPLGVWDWLAHFFPYGNNCKDIAFSPTCFFLPLPVIAAPTSWVDVPHIQNMPSFTLFQIIYLFLAAPWVACGMLVPQPRNEPMSSTLEAQSLNHWTTREVLHLFVLNHLYFYPFQEFCKDGREERCLFFSQILLRNFFCFCFFLNCTRMNSHKNSWTITAFFWYSVKVWKCLSNCSGHPSLLAFV